MSGTADARKNYLRRCHRDSISWRAGNLSRQSLYWKRRVRAEVEQLLAASDQAGSFLQSPAVDCSTTVFESIPESPGTVIGPYKLMEQIGEGGFGWYSSPSSKSPSAAKWPSR